MNNEGDIMSIYKEPETDAKLWVINRLATFIHETEGQGTFRKMLEYLNLKYVETYEIGGMTLSNSISPEAYKEWTEGLGGE
jgi:hypothetical protein